MHDLYLVAALALVALTGFVSLAYIFYEERKSRINIERSTNSDIVEPRSWRAF